MENRNVLEVMVVMFLVLFVLFFCLLGVISNGWCISNSGCMSLNNVCCNNECVYGLNCIGRYCIIDVDCFS